MRNSHAHNPYDTSDYCPACDLWHPIARCPDEDERTLKQYSRNMTTERAQWEKDYREVVS